MRTLVRTRVSPEQTQRRRKTTEPRQASIPDQGQLANQASLAIPARQDLPGPSEPGRPEVKLLQVPQGAALTRLKCRLDMGKPAPIPVPKAALAQKAFLVQMGEPLVQKVMVLAAKVPAAVVERHKLHPLTLPISPHSNWSWD